MLTLHLPVVLEQDEDGLFVATIPTLRGCHTQGRTVAEAMERIKEAAALVLEESAPRAHHSVRRSRKMPL